MKYKLTKETKQFLYKKLFRIEALTDFKNVNLQIPKGKYKVLLQREVDLLGQVRQVMD